jgi:hypothetical protein
MTPDQYVSSIIAKYAQLVRPPAVVTAATAVSGIVQTWANVHTPARLVCLNAQLTPQNCGKIVFVSPSLNPILFVST